MKTYSRNPRARTVRSSHDDIICSISPSTAHIARMADVEMDLQIASTRASELGNNQPETMLQCAASAPMTNRNTDDQPVSREDEEFLDNNKRLSVSYSRVQNMIDYAMLTYEESSWGHWRTERFNTLWRIILERPVKMMKGNLGSCYGAVKGIIKHAFNRSAAENVTRTKLDRLPSLGILHRVLWDILWRRQPLQLLSLNWSYGMLK